ncbi:MAG: Omp28-related outer membrane protein [Bacteroidetes bacterium]|nr:Omp28-related outer membrane protein [Bacteroidota bacterium]MBS1740895.1 Omp28-related outer membrane protein [Bacteroidota bacterium]MBS1775196.1 Omp28-related outer membrane protein [Bacteroidota bacterium]
MNTRILTIAGGLLLIGLQACKEIGPAIDFSVLRASDTSYMETPQAATPKVVLVEEATGVQCVNCPDAALLLKNYEASNPGKIVVVALHAGSQTTPINLPDAKSKYDFRSSDVLDLINSYFSETPPKPAAAFDRVKWDNSIFSTNRSAWTGYINQRIALPSSVNVSISSKFQAENRQAIIKVKISYTQPVTKKQTLNVWLMEDGIVDVQEFPTYVDTAYTFNHVMRQFLTPVIGASLFDNLATKAAGQAYERTFIVPINNAWNVDNLKVVAFVNNNEQDDKSVLQVSEQSVK